MLASSHTCHINLPYLPNVARIVHIVPSLSTHPLISTVMLYSVGYEVKMIDISYKVQYKGKTVVNCSKCAKTGLWMMPLTTDEQQKPMSTNMPTTQAACQIGPTPPLVIVLAPTSNHP